MLLNPQFYAEGGTWYEEAYNLGWAHTLLLSAGRILPWAFSSAHYALSLVFPFRDAPLFTNLCGIALQALPVSILLSSRCSRWGPVTVRMLMAAVYLALPNAGEIHVVLANAQWHLGFAACLLALANPPVGWGWKAFDLSVLLLCGLTGPFCLLLLPVVALFWWQRRQVWSGIVCGLLAFTPSWKHAVTARRPAASRLHAVGRNPALIRENPRRAGLCRSFDRTKRIRQPGPSSGRRRRGFDRHRRRMFVPA
jgi:hypothetical protein